MRFSFFRNLIRFSCWNFNSTLYSTIQPNPRFRLPHSFGNGLSFRNFFFVDNLPTNDISSKRSGRKMRNEGIKRKILLLYHYKLNNLELFWNIFLTFELWKLLFIFQTSFFSSFFIHSFHRHHYYFISVRFQFQLFKLFCSFFFLLGIFSSDFPNSKEELV